MLLNVSGAVLFGALSVVAALATRRARKSARGLARAQSEARKGKAAREHLAASEARYRGVFMSATDGFLVMDREDRILEANPAACIMHGYDPGTLVGSAYTDLIAAGCGHIYRDAKAKSRETDVLLLDSVHQRADGTRFDVEVRACKFFVGSEERVLVSLTDLTQRNRAVRELKQLSRRILIAQEEERSRVSMELHDELGQLLTAVRLELGMLQNEAAVCGNSVGHAVEEATRLVEQAANEVRRICRGLRPPLLDDLGLEPAVRQLVREFEERASLVVQLSLRLDEEQELPKELGLCVYRVLQESLNNVSRHADARTVAVELGLEDSCVSLRVRDDGQGFAADGVSAASGCGIAGMRERASLAGGRLVINSAPGAGAQVVLHVPVKELQQRRLAS
jgi:PAS domain S-box-containing protein